MDSHRREYEGVAYWVHVDNKLHKQDDMDVVNKSAIMVMDEQDITKKKSDYGTTLSSAYVELDQAKSIAKTSQHEQEAFSLTSSSTAYYQYIYHQYISKLNLFGYARINKANMEWYGATIYYPIQYTLQRGTIQLFKVRSLKTTSVAVCAYKKNKEQGDDYFDWKYLENDKDSYLDVFSNSDDKAENLEYHLNAKHLYEGEGVFKHGTHVVIMIQADDNNYTPLATYKLVNKST
ncbi:hypothetical protein AKO1_003478 [Acrasis kona]|uniref:Uncharacterized protein n=1 Tax=Acrasis kona TaxID=1008807 RepID=A0AAW2Z6U8_9EUKA